MTSCSDNIKLLIVDGPRDPHGRNPLYRGTYRRNPTYCDDLPDDHEVNRLFYWYLEEGGELGVIHDVAKAVRFAGLWNLQDPQRHFEIVEVTTDNTQPRVGKCLLGFDLSAGFNNSFLSWGLQQFEFRAELPAEIQELDELISRHYAPQLNGQGLFQTYEIAAQCLRSMKALQRLSPNLYEGDDDLEKFEPVGVYLLDLDKPHG